MSVNIQEIPRFVFDELYKLIGEKTKDKLIKFVLTESNTEHKLAFDNYIQDIINNIFFSNDDVVDLLEIKTNYHRRRQMTKKNWLKQLKKEVDKNGYTPIHAERDVLIEFLESRPADDEIKTAFENIKEPQEFIQSRLLEIEEWAKERNERLTDFPYLEKKQKYQIEKAFENDIVCIICDFLKNSPKNWITHRFKDLIENPVFADGKAKLKGNILFDEEQQSTIVYDEYKMSDNRAVRSFIAVEDGEEVKLDKMFLLDDMDSEIIEHVMENRDERFYTEKSIVFDLRPLLIRVYGNTSKKAYDLATKRLTKIGRFSIEGRTTGANKDTKTTFLYNLFQEVKVTKEEATGRIYAEIKFSDTLHQQFITKQTVQIYSHLIHRLENRLSKILIYAFQKERLDAYLQKCDMKNHFEYTFFSDRIRFRSKRIESNLKLIESSLQEFKEAKILVEDYRRIGNGFEIILTPLTESEKVDFFISPSTSLIQ
ncbi:hypothetical protein [Chengkuizengella axinellae]|uniref:Uncharacterized protein n=1 Tax=Chengkuizengella axinellae TaxID=3064388 RepID=A0ABT9J520_9BACL|nr:hypothetical protein [Chengkuizengella sp. 2205SS18-9]MDP5276090.1 hypothetical protein [Chengkuizengella sp. 2205SS18-9]